MQVLGTEEETYPVWMSLRKQAKGANLNKTSVLHSIVSRLTLSAMR